MVSPILLVQLVEVARNGRGDDIIALLAEGANMDYKDHVRRRLYSFRCARHAFEHGREGVK